MARNKKNDEQETEDQVMTAQEATAVLQSEIEARVRAVEEGIQELLIEHNCAIDLRMTLSSSQGILGGNVVVIPQPPQAEVEPTP